MRSTPPLGSFPDVALEAGSNVGLIDDWPFLVISSKIVERFLFPLLLAIDGVMSLTGFVPAGSLSQAPQHFRCFGDAKSPVVVALPASATGIVRQARDVNRDPPNQRD